jgi:Acyl-CoA carboxylase epsilon subunit
VSGADATAGTPEPARPVLRVVNPDATHEEIAALVAVFSTLGGSAPAPRRAVSAWAAPERAARRQLSPGLGGWRASGLPR